MDNISSGLSCRQSNMREIQEISGVKKERLKGLQPTELFQSPNLSFYSVKEQNLLQKIQSIQSKEKKGRFFDRSENGLIEENENLRNMTSDYGMDKKDKLPENIILIEDPNFKPKKNTSSNFQPLKTLFSQNLKNSQNFQKKSLFEKTEKSKEKSDCEKSIFWDRAGEMKKKAHRRNVSLGMALQPDTQTEKVKICLGMETLNRVLSLKKYEALLHILSFESKPDSEASGRYGNSSNRKHRFMGVGKSRLSIALAWLKDEQDENENSWFHKETLFSAKSSPRLLKDFPAVENKSSKKEDENLLISMESLQKLTSEKKERREDQKKPKR